MVFYHSNTVDVRNFIDRGFAYSRLKICTGAGFFNALSGLFNKPMPLVFRGIWMKLHSFKCTIREIPDNMYRRIVQNNYLIFFALWILHNTVDNVYRQGKSRLHVLTRPLRKPPFYIMASCFLALSSWSSSSSMQLSFTPPQPSEEHWGRRLFIACNALRFYLHCKCFREEFLQQSRLDAAGPVLNCNLVWVFFVTMQFFVNNHMRFLSSGHHVLRLKNDYSTLNHLVNTQ